MASIKRCQTNIGVDVSRGRLDCELKTRQWRCASGVLRHELIKRDTTGAHIPTRRLCNRRTAENRCDFVIVSVPLDTVAVHQIFEGEDVTLKTLEGLQGARKRCAIWCPLFRVHTIGEVKKSKARGRFDRLPRRCLSLHRLQPRESKRNACPSKHCLSCNHSSLPHTATTSVPEGRHS